MYQKTRQKKLNETLIVRFMMSPLIPMNRITSRKKEFSWNILMWSIPVLLILNCLIGTGCVNHRREDEASAIREKMVSQLRQSSTYLMLRSAADTITAQCPVIVDNITTLQSASVVGDTGLQYNFVIKADRKQYNVNKIKKLVAEEKYNSFINTPNSSEFKQKKITLIFRYSDSNNAFWFENIFSPTNGYQIY